MSSFPHGGLLKEYGTLRFLDGDTRPRVARRVVDGTCFLAKVRKSKFVLLVSCGHLRLLSLVSFLSTPLSTAVSHFSVLQARAAAARDPSCSSSVRRSSRVISREHTPSMSFYAAHLAPRQHTAPHTQHTQTASRTASVSQIRACRAIPLRTLACRPQNQSSQDTEIADSEVRPPHKVLFMNFRFANA